MQTTGRRLELPGNASDFFRKGNCRMQADMLYHIQSIIRVIGIQFETYIRYCTVAWLQSKYERQTDAIVAVQVRVTNTVLDAMNILGCLSTFEGI